MNQTELRGVGIVHEGETWEVWLHRGGQNLIEADSERLEGYWSTLEAAYRHVRTKVGYRGMIELYEGKPTS